MSNKIILKQVWSIYSNKIYYFLIIHLDFCILRNNLEWIAQFLLEFFITKINKKLTILSNHLVF